MSQKCAATLSPDTDLPILPRWMGCCGDVPLAVAALDDELTVAVGLLAGGAAHQRAAGTAHAVVVQPRAADARTVGAAVHAHRTPGHAQLHS